MPMEITPLPLLQDNYAYLLRDQRTGTVAVVDPGEAEPVIFALNQRGWKLGMIINTHHHADHTGGNQQLKAAYNCQVYGPEADRYRLTTLDIGLQEGDDIAVGASRGVVLHVPGHTLGHIACWFADDGALFTGDTLFSLGCGRLFEGTAAQMWASLSRLAALPESTRIYCGHEYTAANARFALSVDPDNSALLSRYADVRSARAQGQPTIPSTLASERACNPFLRAGAPSLRQELQLEQLADGAVFAELRRRKDHFTS